MRIEVKWRKYWPWSPFPQAQAEAEDRADNLLEMPPVLAERSDIREVLQEDSEIKGFDESSFVFTDISASATDRVRSLGVSVSCGLSPPPPLSSRIPPFPLPPILLTPLLPKPLPSPWLIPFKPLCTATYNVLYLHIRPGELWFGNRMVSCAKLPGRRGTDWICSTSQKREDCLSFQRCSKMTTLRYCSTTFFQTLPVVFKKVILAIQWSIHPPLVLFRP